MRGENAQQLSLGRRMPCCRGGHCAYRGGQHVQNPSSGQDFTRPPCVVELYLPEVAGSQAGRLAQLLLQVVGKVGLGKSFRPGVEVEAIYRRPGTTVPLETLGAQS